MNLQNSFKCHVYTKRYSVEEPSDGKVVVRLNDGSWTGMIGQVINQVYSIISNQNSYYLTLKCLLIQLKMVMYINGKFTTDVLTTGWHFTVYDSLNLPIGHTPRFRVWLISYNIRTNIQRRYINESKQYKKMNFCFNL